MATSIGKLSKSFLVKILVGIIILPFVFWGMGDVFRGGNQNVIATIDSKKISAQEFIAYLNQLNLDKDQIKNFSKTNLFDQILAEYIGKKVMDLEIKQLKITVNDNALRNIIKNEKLFFKNDKFSRTEYEKFLLKSGVTAPAFERIEGIVSPSFEIWLIVSSYKITPPIQSLMLSALKSVSLKRSLLFGDDWMFTESNLLVIVPLLSSAASIPLPAERIFRAILLSSDIQI